MTQNYYAFWKYDIHPYTLYGIIEKTDDKGNVYIPSYQCWFPKSSLIAILPEATAEPIIAALEQSDTHYTNILEEETRHLLSFRNILSQHKENQMSK